MATSKIFYSLARILLTFGAAFGNVLGHETNNATNPGPTASSLISLAIDALGGRDALSNLRGVIYESDDLVRARSLSQNYNLFETDRHMYSSGSQNVSFHFGEENFSQRLDRSFVSSDYFLFVRREIASRNMSMVVQGGADGFVCLIKGNNMALFPPEQTYGYMDLHDNRLNLTIALDPESFLPFIVRSFEDHPIRGLTFKDLQLYDYTEVEGIKFPRQQKMLYDDSTIEETVVSRIRVNPAFDAEFFQGLDPNATTTVPSPPEQAPDYGHALLGEFWSNTIWTGPYQGTFDGINASTPAADLPGAHHLAFAGSTISQLVLEFEESVLVFEAPHHQSDLVIQWVETHIGKPITHLWPSHHHHDHNLDVAKFVEIGASVIVPEMAASFWAQIPGIDLITFTEDKPYIHSDSKLQARFLWRPENPHSADWTYAMVTSTCPSSNSSMLAYTADIVSTGFEFTTYLAENWLLQAMDDGLSKNTIVIPAHGVPYPLSDVYEPLGSPYPDFTAMSFVTGGEICLQ
ncbi:hypothetical protein B0I35DRAFT_493444 [Stachybotrys elegans]|uniref:Metallo-beta-lactamase domain-containing protein n=1 Tax=Stachybotrys elegans TaxID=80388 RepID=A0A8K0WUY2_9HYPO|nr:hypothetical protein B0I35DRAFT_493444 [Stachybotrys elegans]